MGLFNDLAKGASDLASSISAGLNQMFMGTENKNRALSEAANKLAKSIDIAAQRNYILDGFANEEKNKPNTRNIISQTPEIIVLIKKKMFSSLSENFSVEKLDDDEVHFVRAAKKLFENKCAEITAYEQLTKLNNIVRKQGVVNSSIASMIYSIISTIDTQLNDGFILPPTFETDFLGGEESSGLNKYTKYLQENSQEIKRLRQVLTLNGFSQTTNWVKDVNFERRGEAGVGTGVIELTLVKRFNCTISRNFGGGSASLEIEDPYRLMLITEEDIERAMYQTADTGFSFVDILLDELDAQIIADRDELNRSRLTRGASVVTFHTNVRTRIYNIVRVVLDRIGLELTSEDGSGIDYNKLDNSNIPEVEKFTSSERNLTNRIYDNIFKSLKNRIRNYEDFRKYNYGTNEVRKLMRLNFLGKEMIQPMDVVTVFCDSQRLDDELVALNIKSAFSGAAGSIFGNITKNISSLLSEGNIFEMANSAKQQYESKESEKNAIVGPNFPMWLWNALRTNFISEGFGTCIFCGLVEKASELYSDGSYSLSVSCKDNASYFDQSVINTKPGLDQFNGYLYDPLTPFDFEFDTSTGLLPKVSSFKLLKGNEELVQSNLTRFQDGKFAGQLMDLNKFTNSDFEPIEGITKLTGTYSDLSRRIFDAPDDFVYRWKRGIGSAIINQSGTSDGLIASKLVSDRIANVITQNPFGGQDVVNVLSILICGEPYNFNTFMQSALEFGTINIESSFIPETDFFSGVFRQIKKQNRVWGDFVPFKKINTDPDLFAKAMALQSMSFSNSATIVKKQNERAKLLEKLMQYEGDTFQFDISNYQSPTLNSAATQYIPTKNRAITYPIIKRIVELDTEIKLHEEAIRSSISYTQITSGLFVIGNNVFFDNLSFTTKKERDEQLRLKLAQQNEYTKRRLWEVKANVDKNLFIVGSEYDVDYDIQAITKNLISSFDYMNTDWNTVSHHIQEAVKYIGMELFANSQGHIEFRAPKYNRIPSSVLYKMLKNRKNYGIKVYPAFLEQTFKSRTEAAFTEIEIIEDQIRLYAIALGAKNNDIDIASLLSGSLNYTDANKFIFVSDSNGNVNSIREAVFNTQNDNSAEQEESLVYLEPEIPPITENEYVGKIIKASNTFNNFDIIKQNRNLVDIYNKFTNTENFINDQQTSAQNIRERLARKLGVPTDSPAVKTIPQMLPNSTNNKLSPIDVQNLHGKLSGLMIERYEAMISAINLIKSYDSAAKFNNDDSDIFAKLLMPDLYDDQDVPTFLKDMVENEKYDDYGRGSGKRFILREADIISMRYEERSPQYTQVEISGAEQGGLVGGQGFSIGDNFRLANVWSVDYDLWRMYGFKSSRGTTFLPFMNNAELQLAPYALFLLNQERAKIFRGSVTIAGNEAVQPGEVYYVEDRGMLFYSENISHDFSYGGGFTTTIELDYGHPPGEYIPTPLDVIGKNVYKGYYTNVGNYRVSRAGTTANQKATSLGVVIFPNYILTGPSSKTNLSTLQQLTDGDNGAKNINVIDNVVAKAAMLLDTTIPQENRGYTAITVRVYYVDGNIDTNLEDAANLVVERIINKGIPASKIVGRRPGSDKLVPGEPFFIDLGAGGLRNPSGEALNIAKQNQTTGDYDLSSFNSVIANSSYSIETQFALLYKTIDVWLEFNIIPNEEIIRSAITSPNKNEGLDASTGTVPGNTTKPSVFENMRDFYRRVNENFESFVSVENVD